MMRAILGAVAGYAIWTILWLGGNALILGAAAETVSKGEPFTAIGPLLGALVLSIVCSLSAGFVAARTGGVRAHTAVLVAAGALLLTGIGVQAGSWALMPVWYHLSFLVLLLPGVMLGGRLAGRA